MINIKLFQKYKNEVILLKWLIELLVQKKIDNTLNSLNTFFQRSKFKKQIGIQGQRIVGEFLSRYGNREYYNSLDRYVSNNKVIKHLVIACGDMITNQKSYIELIQQIVKHYLSEYPQYEKYRDEIEICLKGLFEDAFKCINELEETENIKLANIITKKLDENHHRYECTVEKLMQRFIQKIKASYNGNVSECTWALADLKSMENTNFEIPKQIVKGSKRIRLVSEQINLLKKNDWVHIYGGIWSGKTQLLLLISEKVLDYRWIDLDRLNCGDIVSNIKVAMQVMANKEGRTTKEIINNFIKTIANKGVLFIDGIQTEYIRSKSFCEFMGVLYECCYENEIKIVSSGYSDIKEALIRDYVSMEKIISNKVLPLSTEEIEEIFDAYNAPKDERRLQISKLIGSFEGNIPGLVVEIIREIEASGWEIKEEFWNRIFGSSIGDLEGVLEQILVENLNEEERKLLYRIAYIGHDVSETIVGKLANIDMPIVDAEKVKIRLCSRWIQREKGVIEVNNLYKTIAEKNLQQREKNDIDEVVVEYYKGLKSVGPVESFNLIVHLVRLKKYDEMGWIYAQILLEMINQSIVEDTIGFSRFWREIPLPQEMSTEIKVLVRTQQIRYLIFSNQSIEIPLNDLINIVNETHVGGELVLILMAIIGPNYQVSSLCMEITLNNNLWGEEYNKLMNTMQEVTLPSKWEGVELFDIAIMVYALSVKTLDQLRTFTGHLIRCPKVNIQRIIEENRGILSCVWENVRKNLSEYEEFEGILDTIYKWAEENSLEIIAAEICVMKMQVLFENKGDYEGSINLFNKVKDTFQSNESMYLIIDQMAKINISNKSIPRNIPLIEEAYLRLPEYTKIPINEVFTCINYMDTVCEKNKKMEAAERMLRIVKEMNVDENINNLAYKVKGEYYINAYFCGELGNHIEGFKNYIFDLYDAEFKGRKQLLVYLSHIVGYMVPDIICNDPPKTVTNGESYVPPTRKMLINMNETEEVADLYTKDRISNMLVFLAELAYYYGEEKIANEVLTKLVNEQMLISESISLHVAINSNITLMLLKYGFYKEFIELVHMFFKQHGTKEIITLRILMYVALFIASESKIKGYADVDEELIDILSNFKGDSITQKYLNEFSKILKCFKSEEGDYEILLICVDNLKGTDKMNMYGAIYVLTLVTLKEGQNKNIIEAVEQFIIKCSMKDDVFIKKLTEVLYH